MKKATAMSRLSSATGCVERCLTIITNRDLAQLNSDEINELREKLLIAQHAILLVAKAFDDELLVSTVIEEPDR